MGLAGIVLLGLLLRLILFAVGWGHASRFLAVDSHQYLRVGQDFGQAVVHGRGPALNFSVYRPPGYPAFIALVHLLSPSLRLLILAQIVLSVVTIVVVYRITALLFDERAGLIAALVIAIEPASIIYSDYALSETLCTLVLAAATWIWIVGVRRRNLLLAAISGLGFAFTALIRPIAQFLPVALIPLSFLFPSGERRSRALLALVVTAAFLVPVAGWWVRNRDVTGSPIFASSEGQALLYFTAAGALAADEHISISAAQARMTIQEQAALRRETGEINEADRNRIETRLALRVLRKHPLGAAISEARGAALMLTGPGQDSLDQLLSGRGRQGTAGTVLLPISLLLLGLILVGAGLGIWRAWKIPTWRRNLWVPLTLIGYFLIFTAGPAYSRFRVPIVPFIAVLAGVGWAPWLTRSAFQGMRRRAVGDTASDDARAIAAERR